MADPDRAAEVARLVVERNWSCTAELVLLVDDCWPDLTRAEWLRALAIAREIAIVEGVESRRKFVAALVEDTARERGNS